MSEQSSSWLSIPEPVSWPLPAPVTVGGITYHTVTLRAPSGAHILKAAALPGVTGLDATIRLVEAVSDEHVPYEVLKGLPAYQLVQMDEYMNSFMASPGPDPLEVWRAARLALAQAEAQALAQSQSAATSTTAS